MKLATIVKCVTMVCTYIVVVVVASLATDTAFAQEPPASANDASSPRYGAVHECSTEVEKYTDKDWETTKAARYGACMLNQGQVQ
jgi:hypothetical protein